MTILEKIEKFILYLTIFLVPLVFSTLFANPFSPIKIIVLTFGVALVLLIKAIRIIVEGSLQISTSPFNFPVLLLLIGIGGRSDFQTILFGKGNLIVFLGIAGIVSFIFLDKLIETNFKYLFLIIILFILASTIVTSQIAFYIILVLCFLIPFFWISFRVNQVISIQSHGKSQNTGTRIMLYRLSLVGVWVY